MSRLGLCLSIVFILLCSTLIVATDKSEPLKIVENHEQELTTLLSPYLDNEYVAGYLYMENIVSDVVMNSLDNQYYLRHNHQHEYAFNGELFFSKESQIKDEKDSLDMSLIYGHKKSNGSKFGNLFFLFDEANNRPLYYITKEGIKTFELTRAFVYVDGTENFETALASGISKDEYLETITQNAVVSHIDAYDVENKDVLFLQTCENAKTDIRHVFVFVEVSDAQ